MDVVIAESRESILVSDVYAVDFVLENEVEEFCELFSMVVEAGSGFFEY